VYQQWVDNRDGDDWRTSKLLNDIREYNKDDCDSTFELACWLRNIQKEHGIDYVPKKLKDDDEKKQQEREEHETAVRNLVEKLRTKRDECPEAELFEYLVSFHKREEKPSWWRYFDRLSQSEHELVEDMDCLAL